MNLSEHAAAVVDGARSIIRAAAHWPDNPFVAPVNRRLWGPWWPATLAVLTAAALAAELAIPPLSELARRTPLLLPLAFVPSLVRDLLTSAPAVFAYVVAWRVRQLRSSSPARWPGLVGAPQSGARFFEAGALPVALAAAVLAAGVSFSNSVQTTSPGIRFAEAEPARFGTTVLTVAVVAGILSVHRGLATGFRRLLGAGFFVWGMHLAIAFSVPWMVSWWAYLPVVGRFAPKPSATWLLLLFDLAIGCAAWCLVRERCRHAPLWSDPPPPPPPPPPRKAAASTPGDSE